MRPSDRYTYADAGFNGFMSRSVKSNPMAVNLRGGMSSGTGRSIQFDRQQVGGTFMDKVKIGPRMILDGVRARVIILDESGIDEVAWFGDLTKEQ